MIILIIKKSCSLKRLIILKDITDKQRALHKFNKTSDEKNFILK